MKSILSPEDYALGQYRSPHMSHNMSEWPPELRVREMPSVNR